MVFPRGKLFAKCEVLEINSVILKQRICYINKYSLVFH